MTTESPGPRRWAGSSEGSNGIGRAFGPARTISHTAGSTEGAAGIRSIGLRSNGVISVVGMRATAMRTGSGDLSTAREMAALRRQVEALSREVTRLREDLRWRDQLRLLYFSSACSALVVSVVGLWVGRSL